MAKDWLTVWLAFSILILHTKEAKFMKQTNVRQMTITALLIALGILIPMISPFKIVLEPASFTLASHVPIMIAMFISSGVAFAVALGTAFGFLLGGFPLVVTLRALTQVIFATVGAFALRKNPGIVATKSGTLGFSFLLALLHAAFEVIVVYLFYFAGSLDVSWQMSSIFGLVGVGTVIHSMVDFYIAMFIWKAIGKNANPAIKFG